MFTGKILKNMVSHGLAFGEHFVEIQVAKKNEQMALHYR